MMKPIVLISMLFFVQALHASLASQPAVPWDKLHGLGQVEYLEMKRAKADKSQQTYHVFVRLPNGFDGAKNTTYPTLLLLDGGVNFPMLAAYYNSCSSQKTRPP